jgi:hypothetical protein
MNWTPNKDQRDFPIHHFFVYRQQPVGILRRVCFSCIRHYTVEGARALISARAQTFDYHHFTYGHPKYAMGARQRHLAGLDH